MHGHLYTCTCMLGAQLAVATLKPHPPPKKKKKKKKKKSKKKIPVAKNATITVY